MKRIVLLLAVFSSVGQAEDNKWSGCYAGAMASSFESSNQWTTTFINGDAMNDNAGSVDADDTDIAVQLGCDFFETDLGVFGVKVMASDATLTAERNYANNISNTISYRTDDVLSFSARYGFKVGNNGLIYGQLGYVQSSNKYDDVNLIANPSFIFTGNKDKSGVSWGIGYERLIFDHVSLFAEYNLTDFGKDKVSLTDLGSSNIFDYEASINQDLSQFNLGINYRF